MRNSEINQRVAMFELKLFNVLYDKHNLQYETLFYLTEHCNLRCPGCYMHAGPNVDKKLLPTHDIEHFLHAFKRLDNYNRAAVFSGGEIFTAPTNYLEYNIQNALDSVDHLQLKTNGSWINNKTRADEIFKMLGDFNVPRGLVVTDEQIKEFLSRFKLWYRLTHRNQIREQLFQEFPTVPALDLCVSVDNKIHPAKSAYWFREIANRVARDENLSKNISLKTFSFVESQNFFIDKVLVPMRERISDMMRHSDGLFSYSIDGVDVLSFFGEFTDVSKPASPADATNIGVMGPDGKMRIVFYFYPDRTVSFCSDDYRDVGRISYVDSRGGYKCFDQLRREMMSTMVDQYRRQISR